MGSYTFRWEHPAVEVYVTGTFDNWSKSVKLDKKGTVFEKEVLLPDIGEAILYKFVADGEWQHDPTARLERDDSGNVNNVLYPENIEKQNAVSHITSSVAPGASTTAMAGAQPLESERSPPPGAFPETPAVASDSKNDEQKHGLGYAAAGATGVAAAGAAALGLSSGKKDEKDQTYSVNPIPASAGAGNPVNLAPGEKVPSPSTINNNTVTSTVHDDPSLKSSTPNSAQTEQTFGVAPIPASGGTGNPIHLQPGEKVPEPSTVTGNTLTSNVKLDKESYEKSSSGAPQLPPVLSPQSEMESAGGAAIFGGLGPQTSNMIPESSMAMGKDAPALLEGAAISSVGANSTTNQLAGQVPKEPRGVPEVVTDSQKDAHVGPEAAANPTAVQEKKEVERELKAKVPEEQAGSESKDTSKSESNRGVYDAVAGGIAGAGVAAAGTAAYLNEKAKGKTGTDPVSNLPESIQKAINEQNAATSSAATSGPAAVTSTATDASRKTTTSVPPEVSASQKEAHADPEAAANPEAVKEKSQAEQELLKKLPASEASGEPAPTTTAATTTTAPAASGAPQLADPVGGGLAPISMDEKPAGSKGLNAPAASQAQTPATKVNELAKIDAQQDSRDVSPMTKPSTTEQTQPAVTSGVNSSTAPSTSRPVGTPRNNDTGAKSTPQKRNSIMDRFKGTPDSQKTPETSGSGKKKGLFSRIKDKLKQ
ncbi:Hypothetical predicted protein [Lecanosticta acicola]|uniref:AMP-activated protein kinase glycogen-binding domain-containing protein n=1 Tax=Lecanosticta acicola TaxID=111012 RepID=A0AAI8Z6G2_9PEZI|nr:Hypothetical predicted protein [Lecanosticta acicola]